MTYALNELEGLLKRAVVGAGLPVGHAVAIAPAGVWLGRRGLPVCEIVARAVSGGMRESRIECRPGLVFRAARAAIDGPSAIDTLLAGGDHATVTLVDVDEPALLLGLAGVAAYAYETAIALRAGDAEAVVAQEADVAWANWRAPGPRTVVMGLRRDRGGGEAASELATRYDPAACGDKGWDQLEALARKTYVPASDRSRLSGAGAGLIDND